ncbi:MAG: DUF4286 family protein [Pseudomonadota bacterium]
MSTSQVCYEVTMTVEAELVDAISAYMIEKHIPEIFATKCFERAEFVREGAQRFRAQYWAADQATLDEYLKTHTEALRLDFIAHFPKGIAAERAFWKMQASWG